MQMFGASVYKATMQPNPGTARSENPTYKCQAFTDCIEFTQTQTQFTAGEWQSLTVQSVAGVQATPPYSTRTEKGDTFLMESGDAAQVTPIYD